MVESNRKVPVIRFNGFTADWEQRKLGAFSKEIKRTSSNNDSPVMMITASNGFIRQSERYAFDNAGKSLSKYVLLFKGELAYNHGASKIRPFGSCFSLKSVESARIPYVYHCFSVEKSNAEFVSMVLNSKEVEKQLRKIVSSGARMDGLLNISFDDYASVSLMLPRTVEQNVIVNFINNVDNLITLHQRKYDALKKLKQGLLQRMFPQNGDVNPKVRFKGFVADWEQRKLSELGEIMTGSTPSTSKTEYYSEDGIPWVTPTDINEQTICDTPRKLSEEGAKVGRVVPANTILCTCIASIGKNTLLTVKGSFNQQINSLTPNEDNDAYFLLTESENWSDKMKRMAASGTMQIVNKTEFSELLTRVPKLEEQKKIGIYFLNLDNLITLHQRRYEQLQKLKKAFLKKMFV